MSAQARILVVANGPDLLQSLAAVTTPLGHLLMHAQTADDLAQRLSELRPELLVIDADAPLARDAEKLADVLGRIRGDGTRPQLVLIVRPDDTLRETLCISTRADDVLDKPLNALDLEVCVRTAVRVHRSSAHAMRDRDILNALFELSTFSKAYASTDEVLEALARRV